MNDIEFVRLADVDSRQIIDLMNNELVGRQLPLLSGGFSTDDLEEFLTAKEQLWNDHGFGPWAFMIRGQFAGWGGMQPEHGDVDFALVLHPEFWGWGKNIFNRIRDHAFNEMGLNSFTILLPPSRPNSKAVTRFGFVEEGQVTVGGEDFSRFRLTKPER